MRSHFSGRTLKKKELISHCSKLKTSQHNLREEHNFFTLSLAAKQQPTKNLNETNKGEKKIFKVVFYRETNNSASS